MRGQPHPFKTPASGHDAWHVHWDFEQERHELEAIAVEIGQRAFLVLTSWENKRGDGYDYARKAVVWQRFTEAGTGLARHRQPAQEQMALDFTGAAVQPHAYDRRIETVHTNGQV